MASAPGLHRPQSWLRSLALALALGAVYFVAAWLGLKLAFLHVSATPVWPPTGIALAAFLIFGSRFWPSVLVAAFLVNLGTAGNVWTSLGIAAGNTLEGLLGAWLVDRFANGRAAFDRPRDVFRFTILAGFLSTTVSATLGVTSLALGGFAPWDHYRSIWLTWWIGDVGGDLVVAPLLLLWIRGAAFEWKRRQSEALLLIAFLAIIAALIFGGLLPTNLHPVQFFGVPFLLWTTFRFSQREAATATAVLSTIAIWGALRGFGPFIGSSPNDSLLLLAAFLAVMGVTTLTVASAVAEERRVEEALAQTAAIVESSNDAIIGKALDGTIVSWNGAAEKLYGYAAHEAIGRSIAILATQDSQDELTKILATIRRGEYVGLQEAVRLRKDGRRVTVFLTVSPVRDRQGQLVGASVIARDITERKEAESRENTRHAVSRCIAAATTLRDAAPRVLRALCDGLGWDLGELWILQADSMALRREARWPPATLDTFGSDAQGRSVKLSPGDALPRRAFETRALVSVEDAAEVGASGFRAALVSPVTVGNFVGATLALYSSEPRTVGLQLAELMADIAVPLGQFIEREAQVERLTRLQKAIETIEMGVTISDMSGRILYTNPAEAAMHGYRPQELIGKHVTVFMPREWRPASRRPPEPRSWRRETVNVRKDGSTFPVQLLSDVVTSAEGSPIGVVTYCEEITERKRAEDALRSSEERYRLLFERNLSAVFRATIDGRLLECNDAFARILGYSSREEVLRHSAWDLFFSPSDREACLARLRESGTLNNYELRMKRKDSTTVWVLESETLLPSDDGHDIVEGSFIDITERKLAEERVAFRAYHDALTGLPNRTFLWDRMSLALSQAQRHSRGLALLFVDLDRFKEVNDTYGHAVGDRLLQEVSGRLKECVREDDVVARLAGDEFVILLPRVRDADGATRIASKVLGEIANTFRIEGYEIHVTASAGIALYPHDGYDADTLLKSADAAMYRAKELGRNAYLLCDPGTARLALEHRELLSELRRAVKAEGMTLLYQPLLSLTNHRVIGGEALLRWPHPEKGLLPPSQFIPLVEEVGLIGRLGEWTLRRACQDAKAWNDRGLSGLRVCVNLSARQFRQATLTKTVERVLRETGLSPAALELEVSESIAMQNFDLALPVLRRLVATGVRVAIDDFGTGYSSLSSLKLLPINRIKVDRSFIMRLGREPKDTAIVEAVIRMAHNLGLGVVAEGVETETQLALLRDLACDEIQGHVFSDAIPEDSFEQLVMLPHEG